MLFHLYKHVSKSINNNLSTRLSRKHRKTTNKKKAHERHQNLSKEEKEKRIKIVFAKLSQKIKKKSLLSIEKNIIE